MNIACFSMQIWQCQQRTHSTYSLNHYSTYIILLELFDHETNFTKWKVYSQTCFSDPTCV